MKKRWISLALAAVLAFGVPGAQGATAAGSPQPMSRSAAVRSLQSYNIIDNKPEAELRLNDGITRAEMAKILVAALKLQPSQGAAPFPDTTGHWAAGFIAVAREKGIFQGREDGRFYPESPVTYAEVLTVLVRLTGRGPQAAANWPWGAITTAAELGMVPADMDLGGRMHEAATRENVFRLTAMAAGRVPLAGSADTLLQSLGDRTPPTLDLTRVPAVTGERRPTISGRATDAVTVTINGNPADLQPDGSFSAVVELTAGTNSFTFVAMDGAGNRAERSVQVRLQPLAKLEFTPATIETSVGEPFTPVLTRYDAEGGTAPADGASWSYDTSALTRDPATGKFTAARPGEYVLRAVVEGIEAIGRVVVAGDPAQLQVSLPFATVVAGGSPVPVTVRILDSEGRLVTKGTHQVQMNLLPSQNGTFDTPMLTVVRGQGTAYLTPGLATGGLGIQATILGVRPLSSPVVPISVEPRRMAAIQLTTLPANARPTAGQRVSIVATAVDQVGVPIAVREDTTVTLRTSATGILRMDRTTAVIKAGTTASDALDGAGSGIGVTTGTPGSISIYGSAGGMTVKAATFTARESTGKVASLDLEVVRGAAPADKLSAALVSVTRRDAEGAVVTGETTPLVLFTPTAGVSVSQVSDSGGVALFAVRAGTAGRVALTAGMPGRPDLNSQPGTVAFALARTQARPTIRVSSQTATAGGSITAFVSLEAGAQVMANPGPPLTFQLEAPGAQLSVARVTIPTGATRSNETTVTLPTSANVLNLSGQMVGGDTLFPAIVSILPAPPVVPEQAPSGANLVVVPASSGRAPVAGEEVKFTVRARDGLKLKEDAYAFGLKIRINGQEVVGTMPPSLRVSVGGQALQPQATLRTTRGETDIWVRYTGVGTVELEPVTLGYTALALDQFGVAGPANYSVGFTVKAGKIAFKPGPLDHLDIQVSPNLGDLTQGIIKAAAGRFATVRLGAVDRYGNPAGEGCLATLTQVRTQPAGALVLRAGGVDVAEHSQSTGAQGYAEFLIAATGPAEAITEWAPMMICGTTPLTTAKNIVIRATDLSAPTPTVELVAGTSSSSGTLRSTDAALEIRLNQAPAWAPETAEVLVYEGATLLGRFGPIAPRSAAPADRTIKLPPSLFGIYSRSVMLRLRIHSGSAVSDESLPVYVYFISQP